MKIKISVSGYVEGYVTLGEMDGAVEFHGEVPDGFNPETCTCYRLEDSTLILDAEKLAFIQSLPVMREELASLHQWLAWYDVQIMQYTRAERLGAISSIDIVALDIQAAVNQARINDLRVMLNS